MIFISKSTSKRILRNLKYILLFAAIAIITVILVAIGRGYRIDWRTGQIVGGGLLIVDSAPDSAKIIIDGKTIRKTTPARIPLRAGTYDVQIKKDGYKTWQKSLSIETSEVTWAQYPILVPTELEVSEVSETKNFGVSAHSPNERFAAVAVNNSKPHVLWYEIGKSNAISEIAYQLPNQLISKGAKIVSLDWANDSEHILIGIRSDSKLIHITTNIFNPDEAQNLSNVFKRNFTNLRFSANNWRELYWNSSAGLHVVDIADSEISKSLAKNINGLLIEEEGTFAVQTIGERRRIIRIEADTSARVIVDNLEAANYQLEFSNFEGQQILIVLNGKSKRVSLYDATNESQRSLGTFETVTADSISVSPKDRFLLMQSGSDFASFDFDFERLHRFKIGNVPSSPLSWFGEFYLMGVVDNSATMFEFDGGNLNKLADSASSKVFGSSNRRWIHFISPGEGGEFRLSRIQIRP